MKKELLLMSLSLVVILSGCVEQPMDIENFYKNDVVTIEDYYVSDKHPYPNSIVIIEFLIKNNGEEDVPLVEVGFPNHPGFIIEELVCEGSDPVDKDEDGKVDVCIFDKDNEFEEIESLDTRSILLTLKTMDLSLLNPQKYTMTYYVQYDYSGFRKMDIPVIDGTTLKKPLSSYSQSTTTYGPIQMKFELLARGEMVIDDQTIKEYWGVGTTPFKVEMKFTHVGSSSMGTIREPKIDEKNIKLDLRGSLESSGVGRCDFGEGEGGYLYSNDELDIPGEMTCSFQAFEFVEPQITATIWADFDYTYRYTRSEQFEIQPVGY